MTSPVRFISFESVKRQGVQSQPDRRKERIGEVAEARKDQLEGGRQEALDGCYSSPASRWRGSDAGTVPLPTRLLPRDSGAAQDRQRPGHTASYQPGGCRIRWIGVRRRLPDMARPATAADRVGPRPDSAPATGIPSGQRPSVRGRPRYGRRAWPTVLLIRHVSRLRFPVAGSFYLMGIRDFATVALAGRQGHLQAHGLRRHPGPIFWSGDRPQHKTHLSGMPRALRSIRLPRRGSPPARVRKTL